MRLAHKRFAPAGRVQIASDDRRIVAIYSNEGSP